MEHVLSLLEYDEDDLRKRISTQAIPKFIHVNMSIDRILTPDETSKLGLFKQECHLDRFLYHSGTDFHLNHFTPPTGYAATFHEDTTFSPALFEHPFRVFACITVDKKHGRVKDEDITRWKRILNATIPDVSPRPPIYGKTDVKSGDWTPSLGRMSWLGVGDQLHSIHGQGARCIYVVCGLDSQTIDDLHHRFYQAKQGSFKQVMPMLEWCREIARENARRLLYMAATYLQLQTKAEIHEGEAMREKRKILQWEARWLKECGLANPSDVWAGTEFPEQPPNECPSYPSGSEEETEAEFDIYPRSVVPEYEVFLDNVIPYPHVPNHIVRLSDCCALEGPVVRVMGPDDVVMIWTSENDPESGVSARWLHSFPSQGLMTHTLRRRKCHLDDVTTLTKEPSPYLTKFAFKALDTVALEQCTNRQAGVMTIEPLLVRVTTVEPEYMDLISREGDEEEEDD